MIEAKEFEYHPSIAKRIAVAAINSSVWIYGLIFLKWSIFEAHMLLLIDMSLFVFFGSLKVLLSLYGEGFFDELSTRIFLALGFAFPAELIVIFISKMDIADANTWHYMAHSNNRWLYGIMVLNYTGFFFHDFIYSGNYKIANPMIEGVSDFVSILVLSIIASMLIGYTGGKTIAQDPRLYLFSALGIIVGRFGMEVFLSIKTKTFLRNTDE